MLHDKYDVVVIGAGLTGLTTAFYLKKKGIKVAVIEKSNRCGGQIETFHEDGFVFEKGPNTGVVSYPEVAELFTDLAPLCKLETAKEESKKRLIWKGKKFHAIPSSLIGGIFTPLFTLPDKFRLLGEPFRKKGTDPNESVAHLARRRMGKSFVNYAVDPFLSGVYAGNPETLITRYALPKLYNLEQEYGSFIKGAIKKAKLPKSDRDKLATKKVFSAEGGLENIVTALVESIGKEHIYLNAENIKVEFIEYQKWNIAINDTNQLESKIVVSTAGSYSLPSLFPFIAKEDMEHLTNLTYAPVVQASVGVKDTEGLEFNAFGGLVPSCEKREVLGILFPSACFENRAPKGGALFSFFIGGIKHKELTVLNDEELKQLIVRNFHSMLHFPKNKQPDLIHIFRHKMAIPQYELNSGERFATIDKIEKEFPGLIISGNLKGGIGMADRIKQGVQMAQTISI